MNTQYLFLVTASVLLLVATNSDALTKTVKETAETIKLVTSRRYQELQESIITTSREKDSLAAKATIQAIEKAASKCEADGVPTSAVNAAKDGPLSAIRLVAAAVRNTNSVFNRVLNLAEQDLDAAIDAVKDVIKSDKEIIFIVGFPIYKSQGSVVAFTGGAAQQVSMNSTISIHTSANAIWELLEIVENAIILGLKKGGSVAEEQLDVARETIETASNAIYTRLFKTAQGSFDSLRISAPKGLSQNNLVSGILNDLKTKVSVLSQKAIDATKIVKQAITSTISDIQTGSAVLKSCMEDAAKLAGQDTEAAVAAVLKGIKSAKEDFISGSAGSFLRIADALQVADGETVTTGIMSTLIEMEYGVLTAVSDLRLAEKTAIVSLQAGSPVGIAASVKIAKAAENSLLTLFADGAEIVFDVLRKL